MKKLFALLLSIVLVLSTITIPAYAGTDGKVREDTYSVDVQSTESPFYMPNIENIHQKTEDSELSAVWNDGMATGFAGGMGIKDEHIRANCTEMCLEDANVLPMQEDTMDCHEMTGAWFGDVANGTDEPWKALIGQYFSDREKVLLNANYKGESTDSALTSNQVKAEALVRAEGVKVFQEHSKIKILDAETTIIYDDEHTVIDENGSIICLLYTSPSPRD